MKKVTIKINQDRLNFLYTIVMSATTVQENYNTMNEKLLLVNLITIAKKLNDKCLFPVNQTKLTLTGSEAISFWLVFNKYACADSYQLATLRSVLDSIHKEFA